MFKLTALESVGVNPEKTARDETTPRSSRPAVVINLKKKETDIEMKAFFLK